ncbi:MAG: LysR family transcriptional regulator [Bdellovibrionales bacterium]
MDIDKLRYFCTIGQTGSLTKASEILNISQPALSKALKGLESEFDEPLTSHVGRGIALTDFGVKLMNEAMPLVDKINNLKFLNENKIATKNLNISTFEVFSTYFLGKIIKQSFSDYNVNVLELTPGHLENSIVNEQSNIGITYLPIPNPNLDMYKITSIEMAVFGIHGQFKNKNLRELPFVAPNIPISGNPTKVRGLDGWPDHEFPRNIKFRVTMMETALELCRQGECVGFLPKFLIKLHNQSVKDNLNLKEIKINNSPNFKRQDVYMVKRKSDSEGAVFKKVAKELRKIGCR